METASGAISIAASSGGLASQEAKRLIRRTSPY
jgi:hypothetical protein